jgi:hypothetical protein
MTKLASDESGTFSAAADADAAAAAAAEMACDDKILPWFVTTRKVAGTANLRWYVGIYTTSYHYTVFFLKNPDIPSPFLPD